MTILKAIIWKMILPALWLLLVPNLGFCLTDRDVVQLKESGISDETLAMIIQNKTIETGAFTVKEIIGLKQSGMSEKIIRSLVKENPFLKDTEPTVYGKAIEKQRAPTVDDIIALKKAGVSDDVVQALINRPETDEDRLNTERAWQMLENMELRVNER